MRAIDDGAWVQERTAALISSRGDGEVGEIKERTALAAALVNQLAE
ncbi:MAG: hypothetical protein HZA54_06575 [Planctomycetes bacterium]|nr:hypothetical protein [Planctomycetota bacterium]